jgi:hypothetical protein
LLSNTFIGNLLLAFLQSLNLNNISSLVKSFHYDTWLYCERSVARHSYMIMSLMTIRSPVNFVTSNTMIFVTYFNQNTIKT